MLVSLGIGVHGSSMDWEGTKSRARRKIRTRKENGGLDVRECVHLFPGRSDRSRLRSFSCRA